MMLNPDIKAKPKMTADEMWEKACEMLDIAPICSRCSDIGAPHRLYPDRGDPAAAMKMLERLWNKHPRELMRTIHAYPYSPDALAAAVVATQKQSR